MSKKNKRQNFVWLEDFRRVHLEKSSRNPGLAALMSFFAMGLGQIYAGHIDRGIILLFIHVFSLLFGYSLCFSGFIYDWLFPLLGPHLIVSLSYILTVFFILLWIYNIKDAYYLSIFSSFRDWFEVERVLLPSMGVPKNLLLSFSGGSSGFIEDKSVDVALDEAENTANTGSEEKLDDESVINVTASKSSEPDCNGEEQEVADFDYTSSLVFMNSPSWRLYAAMMFVIFVCLGVGISLYDSEKTKRKEVSLQLDRDFEFNLKTKLASVDKENYSNKTNAVVKEVPKEGNNEEEKASSLAVSDFSALIASSTLGDSEIASPDPVLTHIKTENSFLHELASSQKIGNFATKPTTGASPQIQHMLPQIGGSSNIPQLQIVLTQDQIDEYVKQRMRTLLATARKNSGSTSSYMFATGSAEDELGDSEEVVALDDLDAAAGDGTVVVIQGNKGTKLIKKINAPEDYMARSASKVLYEAPSNKDDVEIVVVDENKNLFGDSIASKSSDKTDEVEETLESAKIIDKLGAEGEGLVAGNRASDLIKSELAEKNVAYVPSVEESVIKKSFKDSATAKGVKSKAATESSATLPEAEKKPETNSSENLETPEVRAKLEKIKERGAYEFYQGNWAAALPFYFEVLKYRRNAESFEMVGIIFEKMDRLSDAFDAYENAYKLGLESKNNIAKLGLIAEKIGNYEKAQKYLEKAITLSPKRADIVLSYARCLDKQGESLAAAQVLAVLRDSTNSYAIKKAAEQEYQRISESQPKLLKE